MQVPAAVQPMDQYKHSVEEQGRTATGGFRLGILPNRCMRLRDGLGPSRMTRECIIIHNL